MHEPGEVPDIKHVEVNGDLYAVVDKSYKQGKKSETEEDSVFLNERSDSSEAKSPSPLLSACSQDDGELPEGWQEVKDGAEIFYWHLWTGTIQYERPKTPSISSTQSSVDRERKASLTRDPLKSPEKSRQLISFGMHSMGWMEVEEASLTPQTIGETFNNCVLTLEEKRHDLWNVNQTWAKGEDLRLTLEGETLKLIHANKEIHQQPIAKMRVWGVGKKEPRDFAYIARDLSTGVHKCHMFRCHGHVSARSITNALQTICNQVLEEKQRLKEHSQPPTTSDLLRPPSRSSSNFNEKPYTGEKKCFTAKYVGETQVSQHSGMDVVNKSVAKLTHGQEPKDWPSVLIEVTTSEIKAIDCLKQTTTMTHRVRFITFLGVAHDERFGAYIVASDNLFVCHVYFCAPHSGTLTKAIEKACKLRFEKMLQGKAEQESPDTTSPPPVPPHNSVVKEKAKSLTSNMLGMFTRQSNSKKKEEVSHLNENEYEVKYFGSENVSIGTGIETLHTAIRALKNGETMQGYLQVLCDCVIFADVNRSPLSKRVFQIDSISYCSMASDRKHFGIVVTCGKGNYACHVFQDISRNVGEVISSIHEIL